MRNAPNFSDAANTDYNSAAPLAAVKEDLKSMKQNGAALAQHLKEDTQEIAKSATAEAKHRYADFKDYAGERLKGLEHEVTNKPVQSVAIAFAAGAVLSLLLGRR